MTNLIKFESVNSIEKNRDNLREARTKVIETAKEKYEKEEKRKSDAKRRGEDTWMLASVNHRVEAEEEAVKKSRKKKKKKEKHKKKDKRKRKKKHQSSSSSDSSSDDDDDEEPTWVEKTEKKKKLHKVQSKVPKWRESWMSAPLDLVPTVTRKDLMKVKNKEKKELEEQKRLLEQPGRHAKELNPYWKDGGSGLPEEKPGSKPVTMGPGDSGLSWLRKSYQRCIEQAKEEGRSVEELAAERWGSLEKIQTMISDAEKLALGPPRNERPGDRRNRFMKPGDSERSDGPRDKSESNKDRSDRNRDRSENYRDRSDSYKDRSDNYRDRSDRNRSRKSQSRSPTRHSSSSCRRSRSSERSQSSRKRSRSRSRERKGKSPVSRESDRRSIPKGRDRGQRSRSRDRKSQSRSRERNRRERSRSKERVTSSVRGRFMKPGEMGGDDMGSSYGSRKPASNSSASRGTPAWKKKEFQKPVEEDDRDMEKRAQEKERKEEKEERGGSRDRRKRRASTSSSSSASSSSSESENSSSENEAERGKKSRSQEPKVIPKILSEKEMNELGAKILKAEIMGNKDQAENLKSQLEAAREARKNLPSGGSGGDRKGEEKEDFVVLTRTDRSGMARPVPESKHDRASNSGKRKRKEKVETHSGKEGERVRYFADDDKYDLKTLVEREKMGTAEDQNSMFARLAGRAEKTQGDDFQVDDIFLTKANRKQAESVEEERDRARAIMEHRQMATAMEKCNFCFNRVAKHLIIAIGTKVYLSLPATKSLTEGHCLIVPMQHVSQGTTVDEDVWGEIQLFRKTLTKLFNDRDEDVVFMETSMNLKYFPHMSIECVPMEKEIGDMAPIYFKKALQDTGSEWSENKKVVDISQKDIRHSVPKGFPYFSVDFGNEGGFAHVIEDEKTFPSYFGKEIIGGMIDADHSLWRKPHKENFDSQRKKVLRFSEMWKPYDWTQNLSKNTQNNSSDSDSDSD